MPFGYISHKTPWKNATLKILNNPNLMKVYILIKREHIIW